MSRRTEYIGTLALLLTGGVLGLVASSRVWGAGTSSSTLDFTAVEVTGNDLVPLASAVSLVALAAVLAVPALRRTGRRIAGAALIMLGAGLAIVAGLTTLSLEQRVTDWLENDPDSGGSLVSVSTAIGWAVLLFAASLLIWAAGVLIALRGPAWSSMGRKYERPSRRGPEEQQSTGGRAAWDALDSGDDPSTS